MARQIRPEVLEGVKELIVQVTGYQEGTSNFNAVQRYFHDKLKKSDTMYFLNKIEVDRSITGMAEKYSFHGFSTQAKALEEAYNKYITEYTPKSLLSAHLNVVKFLLCMSEKPTNYFLEKPQEFEKQISEKEDEINWAEYLKEGIEEALPNFDESFEESDSLLTDDLDNLSGNELIKDEVASVIPPSETDAILVLKSNREELARTVQNSWYRYEKVGDLPFSERTEANVSILWENFLEDQSMGFVAFKKSTVLAEYKVIREILWQLWEIHPSAVFHFIGNNLAPKSNVTISSTRPVTLESLIKKSFLPYIELCKYFRDFSNKLYFKEIDSADKLSRTYLCYNEAVLDVIKPIYFKLSALEGKVREQECTYTLLNLAEDLQIIAEPLVYLKKIHDFLKIDLTNKNNLKCATSLLTRLHSSLPYSINKLDQDLRVTLYLESLSYYLNVIDRWFMTNELLDVSREFLIINKNSVEQVSASTSLSSLFNDFCNQIFAVREDVENDKFLKIIAGPVLQIGINLHLLRLLGDYDVISSSEESIYEEFIRRILEELCEIFNHDPGDIFIEKPEVNEEIEYQFSLNLSEDCNEIIEYNKLAYLVDTSDGLAMMTFRDYFTTKSIQPEIQELTLYEKISKITTTLFPTINFFEKVFNNILQERFTVSGLRVKYILIEDYQLEKYFEFLRHIFLFFDNVLFPFYKWFFEMVYLKDTYWGKDPMRLTVHLHDILMDVYPVIYDICKIQVKENWKLCIDPLEACDVIMLTVNIPWPLNIIITESHLLLYKDIFNFILKIKLGLHILNRLSFKDLEPKGKRCKTKAALTIIKKLKYLRFALINLLNSMHHYIFSFVFPKNLYEFELEFEKSNDLASMISSHSNFINTSNNLIMEIKNCGANKSAFDDVSNCIKSLKYMWENLNSVSPHMLHVNYKIYKNSYDAINPIISPVHIIFDS